MRTSTNFLPLFLSIVFTLVVVSLFATRSFADVKRDLWIYAEQCSAKVNINPLELSGPFDCTTGTKIGVQSTEINSATGKYETKKRDVGEAHDLHRQPTECDYPVWLSKKCYGSSYIQKLKFKNPDVTGALLCRHKRVWSNDKDNFDDVAIIVHNRRNGETCWFQSHLRGGLDGRNVPGFLKKGSTTSARTTLTPAEKNTINDFWKNPSNAADIKCLHCHDNGPWMNSRWLYESGIGLSDSPTSPYKNSQEPFKSKWKKMEFITVGEFGLGPEEEACTDCHKIAVRGRLGIKKYKSCDTWINYTTGLAHPPKANAWAKKHPHSTWMPEHHNQGSRDKWNKRYEDHVKQIVSCCKSKGTGKNCEKLNIAERKVNVPTMPEPTLMASFDGGATYQYKVVGGDEINEEIEAGKTLTLKWGAPKEEPFCNLIQTFPNGVEINGKGTAVNYTLNEGHPKKLIGKLEKPGNYWFKFICSTENTTVGLMRFTVKKSRDCNYFEEHENEWGIEGCTETM